MSKHIKIPINPQQTTPDSEKTGKKTTSTLLVGIDWSLFLEKQAKQREIKQKRNTVAIAVFLATFAILAGQLLLAIQINALYTANQSEHKTTYDASQWIVVGSKCNR